MPISGNQYVAPNWKNDEAPAIDAAELKAMSSTLALMGDVAPSAKEMGLSDQTVGAQLTYLSLLQGTVFGKIIVKVVKSSGGPMANVTFQLGGKSVTTDGNGEASATLAPGNYTATFTGALDLTFSPSSLSVTAKKGQITRYTVTATEASITEKTFTSSTTISFSPRVKEFDVFCVGGGGSGGVAIGFKNNNRYGVSLYALGGAGGYTKTALAVLPITGQVVSISIGSGGSAVSETFNRTDMMTAIGMSENGVSGGTTSVSLGNKVICSASGGSGGGGSYQYDGSNYPSGVSGGSGSGGIFGSRVGTGGSNGADGGNGDDRYPDQGTGGKGQGTTTTAFAQGGGPIYSPAGGGAFARAGEWTTTSTVGLPGSQGGESAAVVSTATTDTISAKSGSIAGAGGGGAALTYDGSTSQANFTAHSGSGENGLVIIRWRYK